MNIWSFLLHDIKVLFHVKKKERRLYVQLNQTSSSSSVSLPAELFFFFIASCALSLRFFSLLAVNEPEADLSS